MTIENEFLIDVLAEVQRARRKFPKPTFSTIALTEEVGELAQAVLKVSAGKWPRERIYDEAVQVAAMALRVALEGDDSVAAMTYEEPGDAAPVQQQ